MPYFTSCDWFAAKGNPLATEDDWIREQQIADAPRADTSWRESARAYVAPPGKRRHPREFREVARKYPAPSELTLRMRVERENLKLMLRGLADG